MNDELKKLWERVKHALEGIVAWINDNFVPELKTFLQDNKELAMQIVLEIAINMAGADNAAKRQAAFDKIKESLAGHVPDLQSKTNWINLLIEIAVAVLKGSGKLP